MPRSFYPKGVASGPLTLAGAGHKYLMPKLTDLLLSKVPPRNHGEWAGIISKRLTPGFRNPGLEEHERDQLIPTPKIYHVGAALRSASATRALHRVEVLAGVKNRNLKLKGGPRVTRSCKQLGPPRRGASCSLHAEFIHQTSEDVLHVEEGALYRHSTAWNFAGY
jgi:hypothetical protein